MTADSKLEKVWFDGRGRVRTTVRYEKEEQYEMPELPTSKENLDLEAIRARCSQHITEIVDNPREYYRVQQILRDRMTLLAEVDRLQHEDVIHWKTRRSLLSELNALKGLDPDGNPAGPGEEDGPWAEGYEKRTTHETSDVCAWGLEVSHDGGATWRIYFEIYPTEAKAKAAAENGTPKGAFRYIAYRRAEKTEQRQFRPLGGTDWNFCGECRQPVANHLQKADASMWCQSPRSGEPNG